MRTKTYTYDGDAPVPITRTEIRGWLKRLREDVRDMEAALRTDDWGVFRDYAEDAAGAGSTLQNIADATLYVREDMELVK